MERKELRTELRTELRVELFGRSTQVLVGQDYALGSGGNMCHIFYIHIPNLPE